MKNLCYINVNFLATGKCNGVMMRKNIQYNMSSFFGFSEIDLIKKIENTKEKLKKENWEDVSIEYHTGFEDNIGIRTIYVKIDGENEKTKMNESFYVEDVQCFSNFFDESEINLNDFILKFTKNGLRNVKVRTCLKEEYLQNTIKKAS